MYVGSHALAYMCVGGNTNTHPTHMYVSIYVYMHTCLYVWVHR